MPLTNQLLAIAGNIHGIELADVVAIALEAGDAVMDVYKTEFDVTLKQDNSPLTSADLKSNQIIKDGLNDLNVEIPTLSEESRLVEFETRSKWGLLWIVDPLDGTKEFVNRTDEFTVNIALVEDGKPVLGVVHAPALGLTYCAVKGQGAYKIKAGGSPERLPGKPKEAETNRVRVVGSRSHHSEAMTAFIEELSQQASDIEFVRSGSALKFCLVADQTADIYPRLAPTSEWDTAAGHIVAIECGRRVWNYETKEELIYNKENILNPWFICN
jgi:3''(2''),5''-bisphosphate nucleotidase, bacterial